MIGYLDAAPLPACHASLRAAVRAFAAAEVSAIPLVDRAHSWQAFDGAFSRKLAERGWVGLTLPRRYGGAELDPFARFVVIEELLCAGAPVAAHWIADRQSGPLLLKFGSDEQKAFYLPRICRGEAFFCIGMSEPGSGSDLASVASTARKTAGGWLLNGQKIWTTWAHRCHYMIALVRTSGAAGDRQAGLSQFVIDLQTPGVSIRPIRDLTGSEHFCEVFFDDVALPDEALVGNEGDGWKQVTAELAFERSGPERIYSSHVLLDAWLNWLAQQGKGANKPERAPLAGRLMSHLYALRGLSLAITSQLAEGGSPVVAAALVKDLGTSFEQSIPALLADALSAVEPSEIPPPLAATLDYLNCIAPAFSLRGGTREVLRGMVARGLGVR